MTARFTCTDDANLDQVARWQEHVVLRNLAPQLCVADMRSQPAASPSQQTMRSKVLWLLPPHIAISHMPADNHDSPAGQNLHMDRLNQWLTGLNHIPIKCIRVDIRFTMEMHDSLSYHIDYFPRASVRSGRPGDENSLAQ